MRICTAAQMRKAEADAVSAGTSYEILMENAGIKAAGELCRLSSSSSILLLCGKGNNGGDGLVIARLLAALGWQVGVSFLCGTELSPLSQLNFTRLPQNVSIVAPSDLEQQMNFVDYLVDGVFGIGFHGELPLSVQKIFQNANQSRACRIALDLPSGMNCDTGQTSENTFCADITYTFGAYKPALLIDESKPYCGKVCCLDIGL